MVVSNITILWGEKVSDFVRDYCPDDVLLAEPDRTIIRHRDDIQGILNMVGSKYSVYGTAVVRMKI